MTAMATTATPSRLTIASVQANPTVGAIDANAELAKDLMARATAMGADVALFPELFLIGYPPEDLALKPAALRDCRAALERLAAETADSCAALITLACPHPDGHPRNAVALIDGGEVKGIAYKMDLPNYGVFDEKRIFAPGEAPGLFDVRGVKIGAPICEDIWASETLRRSRRREGRSCCWFPNGSPYRRTSTAERLRIAKRSGGRNRTASDLRQPGRRPGRAGIRRRLLRSGRRMAKSSHRQRRRSTDDLVAFELGNVAKWGLDAACRCARAPSGPSRRRPSTAPWSSACVTMSASRASRVCCSALSGGVDSAISLVVARDALGADNVRAVMLPSRYTSQRQPGGRRRLRPAQRRAARRDRHLSQRWTRWMTMLKPRCSRAASPDITEENLQARLRGVTLMAMSNKLGAMLMTTGNKSEMAVGYATLYGDMCGGYNVLKDLYKEEVYAVCAWRNAHAPYDGPASPIPERVLTKAPSAELRPDQTDQDSLPPYADLDAILHGLIEEEATLDQIVAQGFDAATVERVQRLLYNSEYKRRQAAPGVKIGSRAFGRDRRYPIVNGYRDRAGAADAPISGASARLRPP